jgi:colanic acid/amylovoran biosynthesis protein
MKITISNCWSYYNKGDAAITSATVKLIQKTFPNATITALAFDPESFTENENSVKDSVEVLPMPTISDSLHPLRTLFNLASSFNLQRIFGPLFLVLSLMLFRPLRHFDKTLDQILRSIDDSNLIVVVGGNYLYSHPGFYVHAIPIIYSKFVQKKKTVLLGHSIGPFQDFSSRKVSGFILRFADLVIYRENISKLYVKDNLDICLPNAFVACDMALFLQSSNVTIERHLTDNGVGITVRPWLFKASNLNYRYLDSIVQTATYLLKKGFEIYLIPFSTIQGEENDQTTCDAIYKKLSKEHPKSAHLLEFRCESPESILRILENLRLKVLIGTRFHSVLLASTLGIPSVIISYQHFKAYGMSKLLGLSDYVINIESIDSHQLKDCVNKLIENNEREKKKLKENVNQLHKSNELKVSFMLSSLIIA